jgi:hypothetical protein
MKIEWCRKFLETDMLISVPSPLVYPLFSASYTGTSVPNFLNIYVFSKVSRTIATFYLFQGRHRESLELLASIYRIGQSFNSTGALISRLIGMAVRSITSSGLELYVLNACENPEEFDEFITMLERLNNTPGQEGVDSLFDGEFPYLTGQMKYISGPIPNYIEAETRHQVSDMKFQILFMAAAAKYHYVKTGKFPASDKDFNKYLPSGIPEDVFETASSIKYTGLTNNHFAVYSFGPDKKDNAALLRYDPTNGTMSDGDIYIDIAPEREFPFPREAVKAANAYELLKQFPNGLPADCFADTKLLPLSIIESTDDHLLTIFSFGPDSDEENRKRRYRARHFSSPSSGTLHSAANHTPLTMRDLRFGGMRFHSRTKETGTPTPTPAPPVPTPDPGKIPSYGRSLQKVFWRTDDNIHPEGYRKLDPYYDPTNGTVSDGDLFIIIPGM